jgi:hypothetical protein
MGCAGWAINRLKTVWLVAFVGVKMFERFASLTSLLHDQKFLWEKVFFGMRLIHRQRF